jgi:hypothetical protein
MLMGGWQKVALLGLGCWRDRWFMVEALVVLGRLELVLGVGSSWVSVKGGGTVSRAGGSGAARGMSVGGGAGAAVVGVGVGVGVGTGRWVAVPVG